MNSVNITGRLTADPELRGLPSGENVCKLRLAVEGMSPGGKPGDAAARVLAKGWLVAIQGRLSYRVAGRRWLKTPRLRSRRQRRVPLRAAR